jgi:glyoxylase-like metal-dependent hydrolase (beta-lactamase superfamily II)
MADAMAFDRRMPASGEPVVMAPEIVRLVAPNPGPFTQSGTCSYILGRERLVVVDPGPPDEKHLAALLEVIAGRPLDAILITHTHRDHSPLAPRLAAATGAPVWSGGPHRPARPPRPDEAAMLDASADLDHIPDRVLADGERLLVAGMALIVIATPGHTMNHLCFAIEGRRMLLSGDHVMGWSTSIVAPPDGAMRPYLASLRKLIALGDAHDLYLPGHGNPVAQPLAFLRGVLAHRQQREASILGRLKAGDRTTAEIVAATYLGLDRRLVIPAQLSVFAQLEALIEDGLVMAEGEARLSGRFRPI